MRTFKTKSFVRFANREKIDDVALRAAICRACRGVIDADLGGGVIKVRVARTGGGRSGGFRLVVLFKEGEMAFFVYGFAKSSRATLRPNELEVYRLLADEYLGLDEEGIEAAKRVGAIVEVEGDD
ncbi:MAG: type II toxin-antitoxin system RelE/ParE family toxin [Gammaproteobacteria bacterium]|nr:type II toxin-antitoxin system RelE/ParE family toxin [Gammaproteobacteria bacterium]